MGDLEQCHQDQQGMVQGELRKEMGMLQKKILMDTVGYILPSGGNRLGNKWEHQG